MQDPGKQVLLSQKASEAAAEKASNGLTRYHAMAKEYVTEDIRQLADEDLHQLPAASDGEMELHNRVWVSIALPCYLFKKVWSC